MHISQESRSHEGHSKDIIIVREKPFLCDTLSIRMKNLIDSSSTNSRIQKKRFDAVSRDRQFFCNSSLIGYAHNFETIVRRA